MSSQRLQKILAQAGIASRRAAEHLITEGRVRVNGRIVRELGSRANPGRDRVEVDGKRLVAERHVYFLLHKPRGVVTTLDDPEGRKSVKDLLQNVEQRVFPVGRLDFQTSGALLLTNDGALAQALLHPTRAVPKTYHVKLSGNVDSGRLEALRTGVVLDDGETTRPAVVNVLKSEGKYTSLEMTIAEGKNRQIHRMGDAIDREVMRLTRVSFAGLTLEGLRAGQMRPLTPLELSGLKEKYIQERKRRSGFGTGAPEETVDDEPELRAPVRPTLLPRSVRSAAAAQAARKPAPARGRPDRARDGSGTKKTGRRISSARNEASGPVATKRKGAPPAKRKTGSSTRRAAPSRKRVR
ncbi:MAG: hypothetical protein RL701_5348 [Pseudomonadota bacterium]